jgi:hypothetical protein
MAQNVKQSTSPSWRQMRALRALASGKTPAQVALELGHATASVERWAIRFANELRVLRTQHAAAALTTIAADQSAPAAVRLRAASALLW